MSSDNPGKELQISNSTKSKAYKFVKSLINDGADGADIHNMVAAISDNVSPAIGGTILMDLISNVDDENADVKHATYWFGPVRMAYFNWITEDWAEYCAETELRGTFHYGRDAEWEEWNQQNANLHSEKELKEFEQSATNQLCVFDFWADAVTNAEAEKYLRNLHATIKAHMLNKMNKDKK